jgi:hypothetical protein
MSIASMIDTKLVRENPPAPPPPAPPAAGGAAAPPGPVGVSTGIVNQLTRWIPSETILLYVALLAALGTLKPVTGKEVYQLNYASRWISLWVFLLVTVLLVLGLSYGKAKRTGKTFKWPIFELLVAPLAFMGWAVALPDTPLLDFKGYSTAIGGFSLLAVTVGTAVLAYIFNKSPDYETIVTS